MTKHEPSTIAHHLFHPPNHVMNLMSIANRQVPSLEFHYVMNMTRDHFVHQIKNGFIRIHYTPTPACTVPSVFYNKMDWLYNNRHLLETMSLDDFLLQGPHIDFIFRENGKPVDLDTYLETFYDLAGAIRKDACFSSRLFHQLWNLNGIV